MVTSSPVEIVGIPRICGAGGLMPSTENLAAFVLGKVAERLPDGVSVHKVRVKEDPELWSDVYGSEAL